MKLIRFLADFFAVDGSGNRTVKYAKDETYPQTPETLSQVLAGTATEVAFGETLPVLEAQPQGKALELVPLVPTGETAKPVAQDA